MKVLIYLLLFMDDTCSDTISEELYGVMDQAGIGHLYINKAIAKRPD